MQRKVAVVEDLEGNKIVVMHDIIFKGKRSVEWADVETYLKRLVGEEYNIEATGDLIYIGTDLPDEYTHSNYTMLLRGANAKAKANAAQGLPEIIEIEQRRHTKKTLKISIIKMQNMGGINIRQDSHCQYMMATEK